MVLNSVAAVTVMKSALNFAKWVSLVTGMDISFLES